MKSHGFRLTTVVMAALVVTATLILLACGGGGSPTTTSNGGSNTTTGGSSSGALPDLIISDAWPEGSLEVATGELVKFHVVVENIGSANVRGDFYVLVGSESGFSGGLAAGAKKEVIMGWYEYEPGTYPVVWKVDFGERIVESNEDNNESETFTVVVK